MVNRVMPAPSAGNRTWGSSMIYRAQGRPPATPSSLLPNSTLFPKGLRIPPANPIPMKAAYGKARPSSPSPKVPLPGRTGLGKKNVPRQGTFASFDLFYAHVCAGPAAVHLTLMNWMAPFFSLPNYESMCSTSPSALPLADSSAVVQAPAFGPFTNQSTAIDWCYSGLKVGDERRLARRR